MTQRSTKEQVTTINWLLTFLVYLIPMLAWGSSLDWDIEEVNALSIFPLFGMWAFAQMWLHYAVGYVKRRYPDDFDYKGWYRATGNAVFVFILLHPALLVFETVKEGLTPMDYVGTDGAPYLLIAYFALASFMLYEVADRLQKMAFWKKNFGIVKVLSIVAMLAIFAHSLALGQHLGADTTLRLVWAFMFVTFLGFVYDSYTYKPKSN